MNMDRSMLNSFSVAAKDMRTFMLKWFEKFPELKSRELLLTGESYAGVTNSTRQFKNNCSGQNLFYCPQIYAIFKI